MMSSLPFFKWQIDFKPNREDKELCEALIVRGLANENELETVRALLAKRLPEMVDVNDYDTKAFRFKKMLNLSWLRQLIYITSIEPNLEP
jgi:hypothetical protein